MSLFVERKQDHIAVLAAPRSIDQQVSRNSPDERHRVNEPRGLLAPHRAREHLLDHIRRNILADAPPHIAKQFFAFAAKSILKTQ